MKIDICCRDMVFHINDGQINIYLPHPEEIKDGIDLYIDDINTNRCVNLKYCPFCGRKIEINMER